jgi:hypothetical protein
MLRRVSVRTALAVAGSSSRCMSSTSIVDLVKQLRAKTSGTPAVTAGLALDPLLKHCGRDPLLLKALQEANTQVDTLVQQFGKSVTTTPELQLMDKLQAGYVNFYDPGALMPYVPVAARGPWVITLHGAIIHDNGGYGMLGFGHNAEFLMPAVGRPHCMANVMTPAFSQLAFFNEWNKQVCVCAGSLLVGFAAVLTRRCVGRLAGRGLAATRTRAS